MSAECEIRIKYTLYIFLTIVHIIFVLNVSAAFMDEGVIWLVTNIPNSNCAKWYRILIVEALQYNIYILSNSHIFLMQFCACVYRPRQNMFIPNVDDALR